MTVETILENDYATLWYHPESKIVHHKFHKFIYGEKFRAVLNRGLEILEEHGAQKWLSDDRLNSALPKEDGIWVGTEWNARVIAAGSKFWAVVLPDKILGQTNMNRFMKDSIDKGFVVKVFEDPDEALEWLKAVE